MSFRITGPADTKITGFFDFPHQITGMGKIPVIAIHRISAQSQNILDASSPHLCQNTVDLGFISIDTGQMRQRWVSAGFYCPGNSHRLTHRCTAGPIRNTHKMRTHLGNITDYIQSILQLCTCFRWKQLAGNAHLFVF